MALRKLSPFFLMFLLFTTCAGLPNPFENMDLSISLSDDISGNISGTPFFNSFPSSGGLVFIGAVGRRSSQDETLQMALENAAERVAIFRRVSGEYAVHNYIGSGAFDYTHDTATSLTYDKEGSRQYVDSLQFDPEKDTLLYENSFFVRVVYPGSLPYPVNYQPVYRGQNKKPTWIDNPPLEINGYEVVVGLSSRRSVMADAFNNSRDNAIFTVISNKHTSVRSSDMQYQTNESIFGYKVDNNSVTYSYGTLTGFYVLDTWIDPREKTVWTLALALK
jgi:hypothetical protein